MHAVGYWQTNMPNQPLPDHLKRFAEEATKRRAGGGGGGGTSTSIALPEAAAKQLKEGVVTTFKNKQKWTLHNGKPEQVQ